MRVIEQNAPGHPLNHGSVIFHAGGNVAGRWADFQQYSEADKDFFDQLLPLEDMDFTSANELEVEPYPRNVDGVGVFNVEGQTDVELQEIPLTLDDPESIATLKRYRDGGWSGDLLKQAFERLEPVPVTKVRRRQAGRKSLDQRVKTAVGRILSERGINPEGHNLDHLHLRKSNFVILKSAIDKRANDSIGRTERSRAEFTQADLDQIDATFNDILINAMEDVFGG